MSATASAAGHVSDERRCGGILAALAAAVAALALADLVTGPAALPLSSLIDALLAGPNGEDRMNVTIVWMLRLPQTAMAVIVGALLGVAGMVMQTILGNPLASPYTLGFSASAGFGAALSIMFGAALPIAGWIVTPIAAFSATLAACGLVYLVARTRGARAEVLVLTGIAVLFFFQSLQSLLQYLAAPEVLQQIVFWLFGSLLKATWTSVSVAGCILALSFALALRAAWSLTMMRLGDANAESLGLNVERMRRRAFILVALMTAGAVSFVGTIGFVGLIAPHFARRLVGEDHRFSLPASGAAGALVLLSASVAGKLISPGAAIPIGIITAIAGVPMLFAVILRREGGGRA